MWRVLDERDSPAQEGGKGNVHHYRGRDDAAGDRGAGAGRIFLEAVGALHLGSVYIGVKHGLFVALVEDGPLTARELAARTGLDGWYVREWLQAETTAWLLLADDDDLATASFRTAPGGQRNAGRRDRPGVHRWPATCGGGSILGDA
jgi:hypothetical protein